MAHKNIPIFIPHLGCPNNCVFCNQKSISGHSDFIRENVRQEIEQALKTTDRMNDDIEIAFFGGSFTGIDRDDMVFLLSMAKEYKDKGEVNSIRLSTRPDYIDEEILTILKKYEVGTIELGIQSLSDKVLSAAKRGHSAEQSVNACKLIKKYGFSLIGQMMIGLPLSTPEDEVMTAQTLCKLGIDGARIYPTVVFYKTELEKMRAEGKYIPLSVSQGAQRSANVLRVLDSYSVVCIRCGLQAQDNLTDATVVSSGAYHPAIGSMAKGILMRENTEKILSDIGFKKPKYPIQLQFAVNPSKQSDAYGYKKENKEYFLKKYNIYVKFIPDDAVEKYDCRLITDLTKIQGIKKCN